MSLFDVTRPYLTRLIDKPILALPLPIKWHRAAFRMQAALGRSPKGVRVDWRDAGGIRCRVAQVSGAKGRLMYIHGGGFTIGSPETHAALLDAIAMETGMEVWAPVYRRAPEHAFPAAPEDVEVAARALRPDHLMGDSAGGNLALVALQALCADGTPPKAVTLISPVVDLDPARERPDVSDMLLPDAFLHRCQRAYGGDHDPKDPRLSPIHGDYPDCPNVHLELSKGEILEEDGHRIARHLAGFGARVTTHVEPGAPHVYHLAQGLSRKAARGLARIAAHVRNHR